MVTLYDIEVNTVPRQGRKQAPINKTHLTMGGIYSMQYIDSHLKIVVNQCMNNL